MEPDPLPYKPPKRIQDALDEFRKEDPHRTAVLDAWIEATAKQIGTLSGSLNRPHLRIGGHPEGRVAWALWTAQKAKQTLTLERRAWGRERAALRNNVSTLDKRCMTLERTVTRVRAKTSAPEVEKLRARLCRLEVERDRLLKENKRLQQEVVDHGLIPPEPASPVVNWVVLCKDPEVRMENLEGGLVRLSGPDGAVVLSRSQADLMRSFLP